MPMLYQSARLRLECCERIATLWLGRSASNRNTLTRAFLRDLEKAIRAVELSRAIDVLVIRSANPNHFLAGPDLDEYDGLLDPESRRDYSRAGQQALLNLQDLSRNVASIAFIEGECTNSGLELALACDFRLAVASPTTWIGFDCSESGMLPCWGASQRLPKLVGPRAAINVLIRGSRLPARAAKKIGLVDHAFGAKAAKTELNWFVADVQDRNRRRKPRGLWPQLREHPFWCDATVFKPALRRMPAGSHLRSLVEAIRRGWQFGSAEGYLAERMAFVADGHHPNSAWRRTLTRERLALSHSWRDVAAPSRVGVCGLNGIGMDLVVEATVAGAKVVVLSDGDQETVRRAMLAAVDRGCVNTIEAEQRLKQISFSNRDECSNHLEAVFLVGSDLEQAASLLELDRRLPGDVAIVATTSTLPLQRLSTRANCPERLIGLGFAGETVSRLAVDIIPTSMTDERYIARLYRWLERCGRRPVVPDPIERSRLVAA